MKKKNGTSDLKGKAKRLEFSKKQHDMQLEKSLNNYSAVFIKVVAVVGAIIGIGVLGAFWYWLIKMLFKVGA